MAAAIRSEFGVEVTLKRGGSGVFDVVADSKTLFSKHETGRFPDPEEVLSQLRV